MPAAIVVGGGLAGLSAAAALGAAGYRVRLFEARPFLGGRAASYPAAGSGPAETIDNCQHVLMRNCVNLLDFYRRLGVAERIRFYREFHFIEPGGRRSTLGRGRLPAPAHFLESFIRLRFLTAAEKFAVARGLAAAGRDRRRPDLDRLSMLDWLRERRQPAGAIARFWRPTLVSAINEDPAHIAAAHGLQFFWLSLLARADLYEMGVPAVPLGELYDPALWSGAGDVAFHLRCPVERIEIQDGCAHGVRAGGTLHTADAYISAVPFERLDAIAPELGIPPALFAHSPITGIHLWFDRPVTDLPHAALLDRTIQWMFNKRDGRYLLLVVSASRDLVPMERAEVVELALAELREFFPAAAGAVLERAHVVKELRATYSARPGTERLRPPAATAIPNLFLAGDWTRTGWPATMEGAVRSGYLAAEALTAAAGHPQRFLLPDAA